MGKSSSLLGLLLMVTILLVSADRSFASERCTIIGTAGPDELTGTPRADVICGRGGADLIDGGAGGDRLLGGPGADFLNGGAGRDFLDGGAGSDELHGGPGVDRLRGGPGHNRCQDATVSLALDCHQRRLAVPQPAYMPFPVSVQAPKIYVPEPVVDTDPPALQAVEFSSENVEIANGDWRVDLSVGAQDETAIASVRVRIEGPGGLWQEVQLVPGTAQRTELSKRIEVPSATPVGLYRVTAVKLEDAVGNSVTHGLRWLDGYGLDVHFEVYDGPDREAPNLAAIQFGSATNRVDTSAGPVTLQIPIEVTDPGEGVEWVRLRIIHPKRRSGLERIYTRDATLVSGTSREGTWLVTIELPAGAASGVYEVDELALADAEEHHRYFSGPSLEDGGFAGGFTQVGAADTTRPVITSFEFLTPVLHAAAGERKLETEIGFSDDWSGVAARGDVVSDLHFWLTPPDWPVDWGTSGSTPQLVSGTLINGTWHFENWLFEDASLGTWTVREIEATDRAGNVTRLEDGPLEDFEAEGWDLSFENQP
jgi:hypothetical protein